MSVYTDTIRERVLTSAAVEDVQRAAQLLRTATPAVKEAIDLLAPIAHAMDDAIYAAIEECGDIADDDEEREAVRAGVYEEAVRLAFAIMDDATRISQRP